MQSRSVFLFALAVTACPFSLVACSGGGMLARSTPESEPEAGSDKLGKLQSYFDEAFSKAEAACTICNDSLYLHIPPTETTDSFYFAVSISGPAGEPAAVVRGYPYVMTTAMPRNFSNCFSRDVFAYRAVESEYNIATEPVSVSIYVVPLKDWKQVHTDSFRDFNLDSMTFVGQYEVVCFQQAGSAAD